MDINECRVETQKHIEKVRKYIRFFVDKLVTRGVLHDACKLEEPEVSIFAQYTDCLSKLTYGSEEYKENLKALGPALEHHYAKCRHHPEHFTKGVDDMTLIDIMEMLADWKAASERQHDGNLLTSIEMNSKRFNISDQLKQILINTAKLLDEEDKVV